MTVAVEVRDLRKRYGRVDAVAGISFDVRAGEVFGLIGPNGAGKTTTIECVIGLTEPDAGEIRVGGVDRRARPRDVKRKIGAALQTTALQDAITPREALTLFGALHGVRTRPATLIDRFGLADGADAPFGTLSGGQRQRVALALAFVNDPDVIFLDEPAAGLDPNARRGIHHEIARMKQDGRTVMLTTHDLDEADALCDRIAVIDHGRIAAMGAPRELIAASRRTPTVTFETARPVDRAPLAALTGVEDVALDGTRGRLRTSDVTRTIADLGALLAAAHIELTSLHVEASTLEDVFLDLTGSGLELTYGQPSDDEIERPRR